MSERAQELQLLERRRALLEGQFAAAARTEQFTIHLELEHIKGKIRLLKVGRPTRPCFACSGSGQIPDKGRCPVCRGAGQLSSTIPDARS